MNIIDPSTAPVGIVVFLERGMIPIQKQFAVISIGHLTPAELPIRRC